MAILLAMVDVEEDIKSIRSIIEEVIGPRTTTDDPESWRTFISY